MAVWGAIEALKNYIKSRYKYQVFLSFRGDTRKGFTDHLHSALGRANIRTYRDDVDLERGEDISSELENAIVESRVAIIVFSKDYGSSKWCLNELVRILQEKKAGGLKVLPVFYDVLPSQVRDQSGSFGESFCRFEGAMAVMDEVKKEEMREKVEEWKVALKEAADLGGAVLPHQADGHESKFIQEIVEQVKSKLSREVQKGFTLEKLRIYVAILCSCFVAIPFLYVIGYPMISALYSEMFQSISRKGDEGMAFMFPKSFRGGNSNPYYHVNPFGSQHFN